MLLLSIITQVLSLQEIQRSKERWHICLQKDAERHELQILCKNCEPRDIGLRESQCPVFPKHILDTFLTIRPMASDKNGLLRDHYYSMTNRMNESALYQQKAKALLSIYASDLQAKQAYMKIDFCLHPLATSYSIHSTMERHYEASRSQWCLQSIWCHNYWLSIVSRKKWKIASVYVCMCQQKNEIWYNNCEFERRKWLLSDCHDSFTTDMA